MLASEQLAKAKSLISTPETWTQFSPARDISGLPTYASDPNSCKFCSMGALDKVGLGFSSKFRGILRDQMIILNDRLYTSIPRFNDTRTHKEVIKAFDMAIAHLQNQERTKT